MRFYGLHTSHYLFLIVFFIQASFSLNAQVQEDFNDSNLLKNPEWVGQLNSFKNVNLELQSNNTVANSTYYLSTKSTFATNGIWTIKTKLTFNTSSLNYVDFIIMSDSSQSTLMKNGYFVRLGGTTDEISLYKLLNGVESKLIDGADNVLNTSNNVWTIKIERSKDYEFKLSRTNSSNIEITEGIAVDSSIRKSDYLGIKIKQSTSSFFGKHFFDDLYVGPKIRDTIAPKIDSFQFLNDSQILIAFNESMDSLNMMNKSHYTITPNASPDSILYLTNKKLMLHIYGHLPYNKNFKFIVTGLTDSVGNSMDTFIKDFYLSRPDIPLKGDLIISEIMADPEPSAGLAEKEYVEIWNVSNKYLSLNTCYLHDDNEVKKLPNIVLAPDSFFVLYSAPSLLNTEHTIWLSENKTNLLHVVSYSDQWYKNSFKKNGGFSLELIDKTKLCLLSENWKASIHPDGGTPGSLNSVNGEVNTEHLSLNITNVSTEKDSLILLEFNYPIDSLAFSKTVLKINEDTIVFHIKNSSLNQQILTIKTSNKADYQKILKYKLSAFNHCLNNNKEFEFELQWPSPTQKNSIIFNELLFNPNSQGVDFIELYNPTDLAYDFSELYFAKFDLKNNYTYLEKISSKKMILKPQQYALISSNCEKICEIYNCKNEQSLMINMLNFPSLDDKEDAIVLINKKEITLDSIAYSKTWHNALLDDENGVSLERINFRNKTQDKTNWYSASSTENFATPGYKNSQYMEYHEQDNYFTLINKTVSPDSDGFEDELKIQYQMPDHGYMCNIQIYNENGYLVKSLYNNESLSTGGYIYWDGTDDNQSNLNMGIYIITIHCFNEKGDIIKKKLPCVVAYKF